jgi:biotin carboxyl carrier protein
MENKFKVKVNTSLEFDLSKEQIEKLNVIPQKDSNFHILQNNQSFKAKLIQSNFDEKQYTITVNSNVYHIKIENSLERLIKQMGYSTGSTKKLNLVKAPMPGIIIDFNVKKGDVVKEGDTLLILEAMKMENTITCPKDAVVKSVYSKTGDTVEKNKLLIEIE